MAQPSPEFAVGDRVQVVPSERHRSLHCGTIREVVWHFKDGCYNYYIEVNGKKVSTRYLATDLERLA